MNIDVVRETLAQSLAGTITFPDVVRALAANGVESYRVDLMRHEDTFYGLSGDTHVESLPVGGGAVREDFSGAEVVSAIRDTQAGKIKYPEFIERIMAAGTSNYITYLTGRKVIYFGRKGDFHIEEFPGAKA